MQAGRIQVATSSSIMIRHNGGLVKPVMFYSFLALRIFQLLPEEEQLV